MYSKGQKKGTIRFTMNPGKKVDKVQVAGDFNGWQPAAMKRQKDGSYLVTLAVPPGRFQYKFMVDNDWIHDPDVAEVAGNIFGTFNSVLVVE